MAAGGRIRGITLEIGGDTTDLANALKGVNSQIKGTQTTLNDVNRLLKLDPTNTELLSQKQKLLSQAVESTKEKLQTLKRASEEAAKSAGNYDAWKEKYEPLKQQIEETSATLKDLRQKAADAKEQFEGGKISESQYKAIQQELAETSVKLKDLKDQKKALDEEFGNPISPEQYDALQREIVQTEQDLRKLEDAADDTGDEMEDLDKSADKVGISLGDMVKNKLVDLAGDAFRNIGQKAVDAAKYIVEVGSAFGSAMSEVRAVSGASAGDMDKLTAKAKEMGATTKFSATESAKAMNYMAMAGWKTEEMLSGIEGVMDLAAASGEDLATTSDIVTDALTAFGESADQSGRLADIMAAASSNANTNVSMMGETFKYAAPVAGALGYSMEDTAVAIGLMANAGIKASQAGTSIRSGLTRLAAPTKQVAEAMDQYGISLTDADGKMLTFREMMIQLREKLGGLSEVEQTAAASALFGKNAMSGWLAVINGSDADFDKLTSAIDNSNGAADEMSRIMQDNLTGKVKLLDAALEGLGIAVYEYVSGPLQNVVEFVTGIISGLTGVISPQRTELEKFIDDITAANDAVQSSIDRAKETVNNAEIKVAELETAKTFLSDLLNGCGEFNRIDLGEGRYQILDATGAVVAEGFEPVAGAVAAANEAMEGFGKDGIGDTPVLFEQMDAVVTYFDEAGKHVETFKTDVSETGDVEIPTAGLGIENGTERIVELFNSAGEKVGDFTGTVSELGNVQIDMTSAENSLDSFLSKFSIEEISTFRQAVENSGDVTIKTDKVEAGTLTIVEYFTDAGEKVADYQTKVEESGNVKLDTDSITEPVTVVVTAVDKASGSVEQFRTRLDEMGNPVDVSPVIDSLKKIEEPVLVVKDEFTKAKLDAIFGVLSEAGKEFDNVWDSATGTIRGNKEEILNWIDAAQEVAMQTALQDAMTELYRARANALIELAKANGVVEEAEKAAAEEIARNNEAQAKIAENYGAISYESTKAQTALNEAKVKQEEANKTYEDASAELDKTAKSLADLNDTYFGTAEATEENKKTAEEATGAIDNLGDKSEETADQVEKLTQKEQEAIDSLGNLYGATQEDLAGIQEVLGRSGSDFAEWAQNILDTNSEIEKSFLDLHDGLVKEMEAMTFDLSGEGSPLDNLEKNLQERNQKLQDWVTNMQELMAQLEAGNLDQSVYDAIVAMGPEKGGEAAAAFAEGFKTGNYEQIDRIQGEFATQMDLSQNAYMIASATTTGKAYANNLANRTVEDLYDLANATIAEAGVSAGQTASDSIAQGITNDAPLIEEALGDSVTEATDAATTEAEKASNTGETMATSTREGIDSTKQEVTEATEGMITDARDAGEVIASEFHRIGQIIPQKVKQGINEAQNMGLGPTSAIEGMMEDVLTAINAVIPDVEAAAQNMLDAFTKATSDFSWTLPTPQLPHIKWDWERITYGNGGWFEIPNFSVDWYAKAMERGMILDTPTIFGAMNGKLLAGGEAGQEAVVGTRSLMGMIQQAVSQAASVNNFGGVTVNVYGHEGQDIRQLADEIEYRIALNVKRKEAGFA